MRLNKTDAGIFNILMLVIRSHTCASMVCLELILFENKLVVDVLKVWKIEVRFCDEESRFRRIYLRTYSVRSCASYTLTYPQDLG